MTIARSKLTTQGKISVPAEVLRRLGVGPGGMLEWQADGGKIVVRRVGRYSSGKIHRALFRKRPRRRSLKQLEADLEADVKRRHPRG